MGSIVLLSSMSLDNTTIFSAAKFGVLGAVTAGFFGYFIGSVFEQGKAKIKHGYKKRR